MIYMSMFFNDFYQHANQAYPIYDKNCIQLQTVLTVNVLKEIFINQVVFAYVYWYMRLSDSIAHSLLDWWGIVDISRCNYQGFFALFSSAAVYLPSQSHSFINNMSNLLKQSTEFLKFFKEHQINIKKIFPYCRRGFNLFNLSTVCTKEYQWSAPTFVTECGLFIRTSNWFKSSEVQQMTFHIIPM